MAEEFVGFSEGEVQGLAGDLLAYCQSRGCHPVASYLAMAFLCSYLAKEFQIDVFGMPARGFNGPEFDGTGDN